MTLALVVPVCSAQQAEPTEAQLKEMLKMVRSDLQKDRMQAVTQGMDLDASQAAKFWPIYEKYTTEREKLNDTMIALVKKYAENYDSMSDAVADELTAGSLKLETDRVAVRKKFHAQVKTALGSKVAARFIQVEQILDSVRRIQLAASIPLVK
jgi:HrpA-like RNA helicase